MWIWQRQGWPEFRWDMAALANLLAATRKRQGELLGRLAGLGFDLARETQGAVLLEEAINTAAIEAEQLDREIVRSSVARRLGLPTAGLSPKVDRSADGLVEVLLNATQGFREPITAKRLWGWQAALFPTGRSGLRQIHAGGWRRGGDPMQVVSGPFGRERVHYEAPSSTDVAREMRLLLQWWKKTRGHQSLDGLLRAGVGHLWFVTIHPFEDGNGRLARAITDMALAQDDNQPTRCYSMSSQIVAERDTYYDVLERSQRGSLDITSWLLWFLECFGRALDRSEEIVAGVLYKADFWRKHAQTPMSERQRKVVLRLLEAGPGGFEGGMTTRKYVSLARVSRATAFREISELVANGILRERPGAGRSTSYELAPTLSDNTAKT